MPQVLYRKYRSQTFAEIYGQGLITKVLKQAVENEKVAHAYLFNGPRGTGKTSTARVLAKALNCPNTKEGEPCNSCSVCDAINESKFIDLIEIDAASNRGIDEIRALKEKVGFLPAEGKFKIYIIDEVHMLTIEAFNALLKTLEEPPENVVFILATTEVHKLPLTIISRTQRFDFKLANNQNLNKKLSRILKEEGIQFEDDALDIIIEAGNGSFRDAETVLEKVISSYGYQKDKVINREDVEAVLGYASSKLVQELFDYIYNSQIDNAIKLLNNSEQEGVNLLQLVKQLLEKARVEMYTGIVEGKANYELRFISQFIKEFTDASNALKYALIPILPIEIAIVKLGGDSISSPEIIHTRPEPKHQDAVSAPKVQSIQGQTEIKPNPERTEISKPQIIGSSSKDSKTSDAEISNDSNTQEQEKVALNGAESQINREELLTKWNDILDEAKQINPHLAAFLAKAKIVSVESGILSLDVPFALHKKALEQNSTTERFAVITQKIIGGTLKIKCQVNKDILKEEKADDQNSNSDLVEEIFMG
ncbi:DNA polymerase III subunit gamma/tau [Candidatus Dojkabacteria bacterium]|uniref:DNA polymerase III subunit gamma/tau n=1 Tax=Candidatus Dojkabacteria bacterium TaxID=2099670 RepID=A0A955RJP5_9BACT|nr:DNA polymerase III subunit gamma/tau [Candidatus Dojkabacteria bacterium]